MGSFGFDRRETGHDLQTSLLPSVTSRSILVDPAGRHVDGARHLRGGDSEPPWDKLGARWRHCEA